MLARPMRAIVAVAAVAVCGPVCACTLCVLVNDSFSVPHPHALRIALATRSAIDDGTINSIDNRDSEELEASLVRLTHQLTHPHRSKDKVAVDILVVDDSALYRVELNGLLSRVTRIGAGKHTLTPIRVVTTVPVVHSIGRLEIRIAEAVEKGLLEFENSDLANNLKAAGSTR